MGEDAQSVRLLDYFSALEDPRQAGRVLVPLDEIMLVVLCGALSGADGFVEIARWGEMQLAFPHRFQPLCPIPRPCWTGHKGNPL